MKRIIANVALLFGVFYAPWWLVILVAVLFTFWFRNYVELIIAGLCIDMLYGHGAATLFPFVITLGSAAIFLVIAFLKTKLRIYE